MGLKKFLADTRRTRSAGLLVLLDGAFASVNTAWNIGFRQFPGEGILLTGMIGADQRDVPRKAVTVP